MEDKITYDCYESIEDFNSLCQAIDFGFYYLEEKHDKEEEELK